MPDSLARLASQNGIDLQSVEKMLGAILKFLKAHLSPELYAKIEEKLPEAEQAVASVSQGSGGLLDMASKLAGKVMGGEAAASTGLMGDFVKSGVSLETAKEFLPRLLQFLSAHLPAELMDQIRHLLGSIPGIDLTPASPPGEATSEYPEPTGEYPAPDA